MGSPNYSYCAEYCPRSIPGCPHYDGRFGGVCKNYKFLQKVNGSKKRLSVSRLEKIVALARKQ